MTKRMTASHKRCLWKPTTSSSDDDDDDSRFSYATRESIYGQYSSVPLSKTFTTYCANNLVIVQEIFLTTYFLSGHRIALELDSAGATMNGHQSQQQQQYTAFDIQLYKQRIDRSTMLVLATLMIVIIFSSRARQLGQQNQESPSSSRQPQQDKTAKIRQRSIDGLLLAILLRYIAGLLRSLTASYSTDTVQALAYSGMLVHLFACDYSYANGKRSVGPEAQRRRIIDKSSLVVKVAKEKNQSKAHLTVSSSRRPYFEGGTVSLNAALFATTLLVSRLSNAVAYVFCSIAVVMFGFYPEARNAIASSYPASKSRKLTCGVLSIMYTSIVSYAIPFLLSLFVFFYSRPVVCHWRACHCYTFTFGKYGGKFNGRRCRRLCWSYYSFVESLDTTTESLAAGTMGYSNRGHHATGLFCRCQGLVNMMVGCFNRSAGERDAIIQPIHRYSCTLWFRIPLSRTSQLHTPTQYTLYHKYLRKIPSDWS